MSAEDVETSHDAGHGRSSGGHAHRGGDSAVGVTPGRTLDGGAQGRSDRDGTTASATVDSADDRSGRITIEPTEADEPTEPSETVVANRADDGDPSDGDPDHGRHADGSAIADTEVAEAASRARAARKRQENEEEDD